jgi:hypothetical protein
VAVQGPSVAINTTRVLCPPKELVKQVSPENETVIVPDSAALLKKANIDPESVPEAYHEALRDASKEVSYERLMPKAIKAMEEISESDPSHRMLSPGSVKAAFKMLFTEPRTLMAMFNHNLSLVTAPPSHYSMLRHKEDYAISINSDDIAARAQRRFPEDRQYFLEKMYREGLSSFQGAV